MGAGHCPSGGFTDWNVCNIHGDLRLPSRCRAMLRPRTLFQIWHFATHNDTLPTFRNHSRRSLRSSCNIWENTKYSWHTAKSTPPDPHRLQLTPYLSPRLDQKRHIFVDICPWPLTFELGSQKNQSFTAETFLHVKYGGHRSNGSILWKVKSLRVCSNIIKDASEKAVNKYSFLMTCTMYRCQCKQ